MSGLSPASARRLQELEAAPAIAGYERGELRAMAQSALSPDERSRVQRLLAPAELPEDPTDDAFRRGMSRGQAAGHRTHST